MKFYLSLAALFSILFVIYNAFILAFIPGLIKAENFHLYIFFMIFMITITLTAPKWTEWASVRIISITSKKNNPE